MVTSIKSISVTGHLSNSTRARLMVHYINAYGTAILLPLERSLIPEN